jgi:ornithine--oxo-acid transaminase
MLTNVSRVFYNDQLALLHKKLKDLFGYDKSILMNGGVESGETAVKMARRWAYNVKKVPDNEAEVIFAKGNFWGRTIAACGSSDDPYRYKNFGPF